MDSVIYLDNQSTTPVDPRVVEAMLPLFRENFGNPASVTHQVGEAARAAVERARSVVASAVGADAGEIVFTSGATESNNLALRGAAESPRRRGSKIVSVATEHPAVLDVLQRLGRSGCEVEWLPVEQHPRGERAGRIDLDRLRDALTEDVFLVSVMLANNEVGVLQPLAEIGQLCRERQILLHCDAAQALGKLPIHLPDLGVDLASFSAHKLYGPKGIGALYVQRRAKRRLAPQMLGGGHEAGLRSGTLNSPAIVGFARAVEVAEAERSSESPRIRGLRDRLWEQLQAGPIDVWLNGPPLDDSRLAGNLNVCFPGIEGAALILAVPELAVSSGSACTSADPEPSHVLRAIGRTEDEARASLRLSVGRFNTAAEIEATAQKLIAAADRLKRLTAGRAR